MKKVYRLDNLECADCAAKMEREISALPGVENARVNFMTQKLTLEAGEGSLDAILAQATDICKKLEPDCRIVR